MKTRDGFEMTPEVWPIGDDQWTWGWVPETGSRYLAVAKGYWSSKEAAEAAMDHEVAKQWVAEKWQQAIKSVKG